jgi:hypothetical protein
MRAKLQFSSLMLLDFYNVKLRIKSLEYLCVGFNFVDLEKQSWQMFKMKQSVVQMLEDKLQTMHLGFLVLFNYFK